MLGKQVYAFTYTSIKMLLLALNSIIIIKGRHSQEVRHGIANPLFSSSNLDAVYNEGNMVKW